METVILTVGSITFAQRARSVLLKNKISAVLVRSRVRGCAYGVRVDRAVLDQAQESLRAVGIKTEVS